MLHSILDLFFPPLCFYCKETTSLPYFCVRCWEESALLHPEDRCVHCFSPTAAPKSLCSFCKHTPRLPFPKAALFDPGAPILSLISLEEMVDPLAGLSFYQWSRLDWPSFDLVVPVLSKRSSMARRFAFLSELPCVDLFSQTDKSFWNIREELIEEDQTILLFDERSSFEQLTLACKTISLTFPKRVYILSCSA